MHIIVIEHLFGKTGIAVSDDDVADIAKILEASPSVKGFHVDSLNVVNQQRIFGVSGFTKWNSPIQQ